MSCTKCPLHRSAKTICVMGEGHKKPDVMFIGEAPGAEEDRTGVPFTGKEGGLLRTVVEDVGISRFYLSHVVKCKPPGDRRPKATEIRMCKDYLEREITLRKPKLIVLLGATAAKWGLPKRKTHMIALLRSGRGFYYTQGKTKIPVIVTYHPGAVLRTPKLLDAFIHDMERAYTMDVDAGPKISQTKTRPQSKTLALDIETTGLNPWDGEVRCVGISNKKKSAFVSEDFDSEFRKLDGKTIIGHNIKFDLLWIVKHLGKIPKVTLWDTQVAGHLIDENRPSKSLEAMCCDYTPYGGHKHLVEDYNSWAEIPMPVLKKYNAYDVGATYALYEILKKKLKEEKQTKVFDFLMGIEKTLLELELNGFHVSQKVLDKLKMQYKSRILSSLKRLARAARVISEGRVMEGKVQVHPDSGPNYSVQRSTFHKQEVLAEDKLSAITQVLNWNSSQAVSKLLYQDYKLPVIVVSEAGHASVAEGVLQTLLKATKDKGAREVLTNLLQYRKLSKVLSTYLKGIEKNIQGDGFIHPTYNVTGTVTGRLSCERPNLQNIPRDTTSDIKKMFTSRFKDGYIVQADHSQLELRVAADVTGDTELRRAFTQELDLHTLTACAVLNKRNKAISKEDRNLGKTLNFSIFYGASVKKVAELTGLPSRKAGEVQRAWFAQYPKVKEWMREVEKELRDFGYVTSPVGRRRRLILGSIQNQHQYFGALRQAVNFPIQSYAADITLWHLKQVVEQLGNKGLVIGTVHDSIILDVPKRHVGAVVKLLNKIMTQPMMPMAVPLKPEISVGKNWHELKEV